MANVLPLNSQQNNHDDGDLLDSLLVDLTPEQRARVLELVMRLDIERDDPLFLIVVATGQLMVLVQEAPNDWAALFAAFLERLDVWTVKNLTTLENLAAERVAIGQLSNHCSVLTNNTSELKAVLRDLIAALEASPVEAPGWEASLKTVQRELTLVITSMQGTATMRMPSPSPSIYSPARTNRIATDRPVLLYIMLALLGMNISMGFWHLTVQRRQHHQLNQRLEWLLQKNNRRDCEDGTLPPDSPLCTGQ